MSGQDSGSNGSGRRSLRSTDDGLRKRPGIGKAAEQASDGPGRRDDVEDDLKRRLQELYGGVVDEPIPDHLKEIVRRATRPKKRGD